MEPRSIERGECGIHRRNDGRWAASMEPRSIERGEGTRPYPCRQKIYSTDFERFQIVVEIGHGSGLPTNNQR